jgi:DedD protein
MASGGRRGAADRVLESRHLVGLFLGVVLLCGVFFTLGYVMGKTQYAGIAHAAGTAERNFAPGVRPDADAGTDRPVSKSPTADSARSPESPTTSEWDFYTKKNNDHLEPAAKSSNREVAPADAASAPKGAARYQPPRLAKGSLVLQIAALKSQGDALAIADELQQKKFPAFVVAPSSDSFYRVQAGPYATEQAAGAARAALDHAGFKSIIKR